MWQPLKWFKGVSDSLARIEAEIGKLGTQLTAVDVQVGDYKEHLGSQFAELNYPVLSAEIAKLLAEHVESFKGAWEQPPALGTKDAELANHKAAAYRALVIQAMSDMHQLFHQHASEYALRRKTELHQKLEEIDSRP